MKLLHLIEGKLRQKEKVTCPRSYSWPAVEVRFEAWVLLTKINATFAHPTIFTA
jgi:hypothetical protein